MQKNNHISLLFSVYFILQLASPHCKFPICRSLFLPRWGFGFFSKSDFSWGVLLTHADVDGFSWINVLVFAVMLLASLVLLAVGAALELRRLRRRKAPPSSDRD